MAESLDMSLDDIIRNNKKSSGVPPASVRGRGRGRGRGFAPAPSPGPLRRFDNRLPTRPTPYFPPQPIQLPEMLIPGGSDSGAGTKLYISNLDYGVSNEDIKVLFSEVGELKRYSIHYDRSGRSKGTAEVVFTRPADALAALKRYNNVQLDGKPMKIEMVGVKIVTPVAVNPTTSSILGNPTTNGILGNPTTSGILGNPFGAFRRQERVAGRGRDRGGSGRGFGRGRGRGGSGPGQKLSTEDLDADLEKYHLEAMQIN